MREVKEIGGCWVGCFCFHSGLFPPVAIDAAKVEFPDSLGECISSQWCWEDPPCSESNQEWFKRN